MTKLSDEALERMAEAAAGKFGWSYLNLEEGDPEIPNGRRGYHDPEGDPTKLYFRTLAQAAWDASPGPALNEMLAAIYNAWLSDSPIDHLVRDYGTALSNLGAPHV